MHKLQQRSSPFNEYLISKIILIIVDVKWDITFMLNRRYDIARPDEEFPMNLPTPPNGTLYHVPANKLFPDAQLPSERFFIHLIFKLDPALKDQQVYLFAIRDPDETLRLGLYLNLVWSSILYTL